MCSLSQENWSMPADYITKRKGAGRHPQVSSQASSRLSGGYTVLPFTEQSVQKTLSKAPQSWVSVTQCITLHQTVCVKGQQIVIFKHERSQRTAPRSNDRKPATNRATRRQRLMSASPGCCDHRERKRYLRTLHPDSFYRLRLFYACENS